MSRGSDAHAAKTLDAVAKAIATRWFGATDADRTWQNMTPYERRRFQSVAAAAIHAFADAYLDG